MSNAAERPQVVLVNRCVIQEAGKLLLIKRASDDSHSPGLWEFPGGKLDAGQDLTSALEREVLEETGLSVETTSPLVYADSFIIEQGQRKYHGMPYIVLFSIARVLGGEVQLSDEHDDYAWRTYEDSLEYTLTPESEKALRFLGSTLLIKPYQA